jgi:chorismate synthase
MSRNSIGKNIILTSFGESHGPYVGAVLDGFPSGFTIDLEALNTEMQRRRPGQSSLTTPRNETDEIQIISGVFEGQTTGSPITFLIANNDTKPKDYDLLKDIYRPGHADLLYQTKYGLRDHRGGGRSSARITAGWVAAGSLAKQFLNHQTTPIKITAWVQQIYTAECPELDHIPTRSEIESSLVRCPNEQASLKMIQLIEEAKLTGDSLGGIIACAIENCPIGLGEPLFGKLQAVIGQYILSINAVKGISFGEGFNVANLKGSENNDSWIVKGQKIGTQTNHAGGIIGGMATGEPIHFHVAFKPTSTIEKNQETLDAQLNATTLSATGRHDPCVLPRAVPIVEAMSNLAIMDLLLEM